MKTPLAVIGLLAIAPVHADRVSDEILASFQTRLENRESIDELIDSLGKQQSETLRDLIADLDKAWPGVRDRYLAALETTAGNGVGGDRNARQLRIRELREGFLAVYRLEEGPMKPLLKSKSMPAVKELRKLLAPTAEELIKAAPPSLIVLRDTAKKLARFRDAALDAELSTTPSDSVETLKSREQAVAATAGNLSRDGLRILEKNRKIAEDAGVPVDEAKGIEEANLWRLYVGLNACVLDPKLCDAARDHSKDMAEHNFFAHDSPVAGKATPWDRARNFGTTSSGENIYKGSNQPSGANTGWFYSPGHHKNMFSAGQTRIGLGHHNGHWTQMFGR